MAVVAPDVSGNSLNIVLLNLADSVLGAGRTGSGYELKTLLTPSL